MTTLGLYRPGSSLLHRVPAGPKLLGLIFLGALSILVDRPWQVGVALLAVLGGYRVAGLGSLTAARQLRPLLWLLGAAGLVYVVTDGWSRAVVVLGVIVVLVLLAALVTLTTRTTDLVDAVVRGVRPLRRLGVDPERVGLVIALGIRCVPVVVGLAVQVRDAQRARGLAGSARAFAVPLIVRSLRHADALGEALVARGVED